MLFPCTNNIVEYEALVNVMKIAIEWCVDELKVFGDSQLVINQVNNTYQTKDKKLVPYKWMVDDLWKYFTHITFQQVPWVDNKEVDVMVTLASMLQIPENDFWLEFLVETLSYPTYDTPESHMILLNPRWYASSLDIPHLATTIYTPIFVNRLFQTLTPKIRNVT